MTAPTSFPGVAHSPEQIVRSRAIRFLHVAGWQLIDLLGVASGEEGRALGFAIRDMVLERDVPPSFWPLADVLELLSTKSAHRDARAVPLINLFCDLQRRVDVLESADPWSGQCPAVVAPAMKRMELAVLDLDPAAWPQRRWRRAHTSQRIRAAAEGQRTRKSPLAIFPRTNFSARSGPERVAAVPIQIARTRHGPGGRSPAIDGRRGA